MKRIGHSLIAAAAALFLAVEVSALPMITGDISFNGVASLNGTTLLNSTAISSITGSTVLAGAQDGTYAGVPDNYAVTFTTPLVFGSGLHAATALSMPSFWSFTYSGTTYAFDITTLGVSAHSVTTLNLFGEGIVRATGYEDTVASWTITDTKANGSALRVTFGHSVTVPVPDPVPTTILLGVGLLGLGLFSRARQSIAG